MEEKEGSRDSLGDRMKTYEESGAHASRFMPLLPVVVRLDGKAFHGFTRGLQRPYDRRLSNLIQTTALYLTELSGARIGYTQSDEITLILHSDDHKSQIYFDGKRDKIVSVLAAYATLYFNQLLPKWIPEKNGIDAIFDCRAFSVPSKEEAVNAPIWREQDAVRNSVSMAAQSQFSHKSLHGMSCDEMQERLFTESGINWNDYPAFFKRGAYFQRHLIRKKFSSEEIDNLPPKHAARLNPDLMVERHEVREVELPILTQITNRIDVIFSGQDPIAGTQ